VEEGGGSINGGWDADFGGLLDLTLMARLDVPLDVGVKHWPPESVEEGAACGINAFVPELVMGIANEREADGGECVELVVAIGLSAPELTFSNKEVASSADKTCECIAG
jgi:hypothetical protein